MRTKTWEELKSIPHGTKLRVKIENYRTTIGSISVNKDERIFICTSTANGNRADNKLGYKYSWEIDEYNIDTILFEDLITEDYPIF